MFIHGTKPQQYKTFTNLADNIQTTIVLTNQEIVPANFYFTNITATLLQLYSLYFLGIPYAYIELLYMHVHTLVL